MKLYLNLVKQPGCELFEFETKAGVICFYKIFPEQVGFNEINF